MVARTPALLASIDVPLEKNKNKTKKKTASRYYLRDFLENTHKFAAKVNRRAFAPSAVFPKRDGFELRFTLPYLAAGRRMEAGCV